MANQIVVSAGAKVRNLSGVLTATSGVVSFLPIDVSLGIPQLDVNGKILVSQLPNSVMEYKGTWDASTNTPTLANGTGNQGDVYLCNVAGTVNFGAGAIAFFVGDQVIYSGSIWQRASGATGTVTSVAVTETGDSLNITGSPITTSGTINIGFNGTNLQYVNGAGNLTTFPILTGYVTAVSGTAPVVSSGGTTPAISMAAATSSVDGYLLATDFVIFSAKQSTLTFSSPLVNTSGTISIPAATTSVNGYLASADFTTFNNKQNAITLTTTGSSGASTLVGATLNIPNYSSALTGYVPYTGATQDVDLDTHVLNAQALHVKGTAGNGHLGLKHQSASPTGSANESLIFADVNGDLGWQNGNLYLNKFITSANTANRSYTFPNVTCNIPNDSLVVHLAGTETITGAKTFSGAVTFTSSLTTTSNVTFSNSGFTLVLQPPTLSVNRTVTLPNGTGTLALTSDISYPVTSVFGRTGAVVATSGDYTTAQVTEVTNLYFTDSRARLALSFVAGSGAYNSTTGVITIPTNNNQITNGAGYTTNVGTVTSVAATGGTGISILGSPITTSGTITITNTAPDQTVALTASTGISVTGTYPNFTITNTSPSSGGTVTSVAALTIGTSGTDLSSSVATSTTTPVITLNVPTASATNRGALSSADWSTFNSKQSALTNPVTGTGTTNYLPKFTGTSTIGNSAFYDGGGFGGFNSTGLGSRTFIIQAANARPLALEMIEYANVHAVYVRPNNSGYNLISSNYISGGVYIPLALSGRENSNDLVIWTDGNTSIGQSSNAGYKLDVNGTGRFSGLLTISGVSNNNFQSNRVGTNAHYQTWYESNGTTRRGYFGYGEGGSNNFFLINEQSGTLNIGTNGATNLTIASTGAATFSSSVTATSFSISNGSISNNGYWGMLNTAGTGSYADWALINSGTTRIMHNPTGTLNMVFNGNVGIGTTSPNEKLDVNGAIQFRGDTQGYSNTTSVGMVDFYSGIARMLSFGADGSTYGGFDFYQAKQNNSGGRSAMRITSGGSVLIGTTTDYSSKLVVIPSSNPTSSTGSNNQISIGETSNNTGYCLKVGYINTGGGYQGSIQSIAGGSGSTLFLNASGGNVLIGTTTDAGYKLDVNGTGRFSDAVTIRSSSVSSGGSAINAYGYDGAADLYTTRGESPYNAALYLHNNPISGQGYGTGILFRAKSDTTNSRVQGNIYTSWTTATDASRTSKMVFSTTNSGTTSDRLTIEGSGAATFSSSVTATSFFESSSIKGKDIIATNPLLALDIDVIKYTRKSDESKDIRYGYSAEQIHSLMPELTDKDVTAVKYLDVHTILISQLQQEIKELKAKMN